MQLFISEPGSMLCIDNGRYCVKKKEETHYFPLHDIVSIYLHKGVAVTHETLAYIIENEVDFLVIGKFGHPIGRVWGEKPGSISTIRKNQLAFSKSGSIKNLWIQDLLINKLEQQKLLLELLECVYPAHQDIIHSGVQQIKKYQDKIKKTSVEDDTCLEKWRGYEGNAAKHYFKSISQSLPIDYQFEKRTRPATDRFNSMLNYCYAILYSRIEGAMLRAGLDPYIGIWHRDEYNRPSLVYDVIEKFRAWADYTVIHLCMHQVMPYEFFKMNDNGMLMMEDEAKRILVRSFTDYLDEVVELDHIERSRFNHLEIQCQKLATYFKNLDI